MKMLAAAIFKVSKETHISVATKDGNIRQRKITDNHNVFGFNVHVNL